MPRSRNEERALAWKGCGYEIFISRLFTKGDESMLKGNRFLIDRLKLLKIIFRTTNDGMDSAMPDVYLTILTDSIVNSFEAIFFKRIDYDYFMRS